MATSLSELLSGATTLAGVDSRSTPGFDGDKKDARGAMDDVGEELADLQERLWANGTRDDPRSVLLVLQGMDTSGKGGMIRHAAGLVDPQGLHITSFKKPTPEELEHDFLWRVEKALPPPGKIGGLRPIAVRGRPDLPRARARSGRGDRAPVRRDQRLRAGLRRRRRHHRQVHAAHLRRRPEGAAVRAPGRPDKHWKYNPDDLDERALWADYQQAYDLALERCSTDAAPWFVVPSGRKWYRDWAVATLLLEHLQVLDLTWPDADFDVEAEKARVAAS